ncbi:hypothetical protein PROFUN_16683, partial [Planoprotostelium fungivorum]
MTIAHSWRSRSTITHWIQSCSVTTSSLLLTLIVHAYLLIGPNWLVLNRLVTDPCHHIIIPLIESPITLAEADPFCQGVRAGWAVLRKFSLRNLSRYRKEISSYNRFHFPQIFDLGSVFHCPFEEDPSSISLGNNTPTQRFESVSSTVHSPDTTFRANLQGNDTTSALVHHYILTLTAMSIPHYNTLVTNVSNLVTGAQGDPTAEQAITFLQYGETHDEWCGQQNLLPTLLLRAKVIQGPPTRT